MHEIEIELEKEICMTTLKTLTVLFSEKNWANAVALYFFYYKQCKLQQTDTTWTTDSFIKKWLGRGTTKIMNARRILKKYNLIEMTQKRLENWVMGKTYVKVKFYRTTQKPRAVTTDSGQKETNALINRKEMLSINKESIKAVKKSSTAEIYSFESFWKDFPHARKWKKQDALKYYKLHDEISIAEEVKLLSRKIELNLQDGSFIPACERWIRDFTPISDVVKQQDINKLVAELMKKKWDDRVNLAKRLEADFWNDRVKNIVKTKNKESKNVVLNFKK